MGNKQGEYVNDISNINLQGALSNKSIFLLNSGILFRSVFLYAIFLAYYFGWLPWYVLVICDVVFYPAIYLHIHDLGHGASSRKIWFTSYNPLVADPIWGGLRAFRYTHFQHHKYFGTTRDSWLPYYNGHPLTAFFWNYFESEYNGYRYIKECALDKYFVLSVVINLAMLLQIFVFGFAYLVHMFTQRTVRALAIFFFNYYTHRSGFSANAKYSVYDREHDLRFFLPILRLLWGRVLINGLIYHNRHHSIKNWHVPVKHYQHLKDEKVYTKYQKDWPISTIQEL